MKLTICSENQNTAIEFRGRMSITCDHGSSAENFLMTPMQLRGALINYHEKIKAAKEMYKMVEDGFKHEAIPYQTCPKCNGIGLVSAHSTVLMDPCDVCEGRKVIPMYRP